VVKPQPWPGSPGSAPGSAAALRGIVVCGSNSTAFDLSSAFRPDVAEYGAAVPPSFRNGTLCLLPMQGAAPGVLWHSVAVETAAMLSIRFDLVQSRRG
jgi:hypothetical protein